MDYIAWIHALDQNKLPPTSLVMVEEPLLWDEMKAVIQKDLVGERFLAFSYQCIRFEELEAEGLLTMTETLPFGGSNRAIILEDVPLQRDRVVKNEALLQLLLEYAQRPTPGTFLFLSYFGAKPFQGSLFKKLSPYLSRVSLTRLDRRALSSFIQKRIQARGLVAEGAVISLIIERSTYLDYRSEENLYRVANLVDTAVGTAEGGVIEFEAVRKALVDPIEEGIFTLLDQMGARKRPEALNTLLGFRKLGVDPYQIFYMTARQVRNLIGMKLNKEARVRASDGQTRLGLSPYEYKKLNQQVDYFSLAELYRYHDRLFQMDVAAKTRSFDMMEGLERFFAGL